MSELSSCFSDIERTATCPTCRAATLISNARQHVRPVELLLEYRTHGNTSDLSTCFSNIERPASRFPLCHLSDPLILCGADHPSKYPPAPPLSLPQPQPRQTS